MIREPVERLDEVRQQGYTLLNGISHGDKIRVTHPKWVDGELQEVVEYGIFDSVFVNIHNGLGLSYIAANGNHVSMSGNSVLNLEKLDGNEDN